MRCLVRATICLTVAAAAAHPSAASKVIYRPLSFLSPYVVKSEDHYKIYKNWSSKGETYRVEHELTVRGLSRRDVVDLLMKRFPQSAGWLYDGCSLMSTAMKYPSPSRGLSYISVSETRTETEVEAIEDLSIFDVWFIRIEHPGSDPFETRRL